MLSQKDDLAEVRGSKTLQISSHIGNTSRLSHPQNCVRNLLDFGHMERVEVGLEDIRIDSSPVVVDETNEGQHILIDMI